MKDVQIDGTVDPRNPSVFHLLSCWILSWRNLSNGFQSMNRLKAVLVVVFLALYFGASVSCKDKVTRDGTRATAHPATDASKPARIKPPVQGSPRMLLVGNSHTEYYVSIPKMFEEFCAFNKNDMKVETLTEMGISLKEIYTDHKDHVDEKMARTDPDGNYYDYVVLQEKTPVALSRPEEYKASVRKFADLIRKNSPDAVFLIYELMSPADFGGDKDQFDRWYEEIRRNTNAVVKETDHAKL